MQIWHWVSLKFFLFPFHQPNQQVVANIQFVFSFHFWNFSFLNNCNPNSIASSNFFDWSSFTDWSTFHLFFTFFRTSDFKKIIAPQSSTYVGQSVVCHFFQIHIVYRSFFFFLSPKSCNIILKINNFFIKKSNFIKVLVKIGIKLTKFLMKFINTWLQLCTSSKSKPNWHFIDQILINLCFVISWTIILTYPLGFLFYYYYQVIKTIL